MAIKDWHQDERPREKLLQKGAESLSDSETLRHNEMGYVLTIIGSLPRTKP